MSTTTTTPTRARRSMNSAAPPLPAPSPEPAPVAPPTDAIGLPERPARRPFGTRRQRLDNPLIPGYQCRWVNDTPGRVQYMKEGGYEHVLDAEGKPVKTVVGVIEGGGGLIAYRMKIPLEWYQQDQASKEEPRREVDQQMRQGTNFRDGLRSSEGRPAFDARYKDGEKARSATTVMDTGGRQKGWQPTPQE